MVNIPINVSTSPTDEIGVPTDINQNINQEYYEWLLKQHNYFPDCAFHKEKFADTIKMEHSYTRDWKPTSNSGMMPTRTILVERPPLCPSCHQLPPNHDEKVDTPETYNIPIPPYNEEAGRHALNATEELIKSCHNRNSDTDDWTQNLQKFNWTDQQYNLFERVERILDMDQLGRLAVNGLANECLRRNAIIEKSVSRMRSALASVQWEPRLTSWLHGLLMVNLPPNYMVSYIDMLQTLKRKIPTLVDKMLYHRPIEMHKDYMNAIMKQSWQPAMVAKTRTLPSYPVIVLVSSSLAGSGSSTNGDSKNTTARTSREQRWMELLSTLASIEMVYAQAISPHKPIEQMTEQLISMTRAKIQEIRNQTPNRPIILAGFNAGAALALQVALVEPVNSIVCLGFAFNTLCGVRGAPDDRIVDLNTPILFVIGQNAQRSSQEEIESLRERMTAQTLLVVVGSSDDALRVKRLNRSMEGVSQTMIDSMILDEIQEFATNCILTPPGPRKPKHLNGHRKVPKQRAGAPIANGLATKRMRLNGKQEFKPINGKAKFPPTNRKTKIKLGNHQNGKNGYHHTNHELAATANDSDDSMVHIDFENAVPLNNVHQNGWAERTVNTTNTIVTLNGGSPSLRQKVKYIAADQGFVHIKPPPINTEKIYVNQQPNGGGGVGGNHLYSSTSDIPVMTVKQKEPNDQTATAAAAAAVLAYKSDEELSELTSNTTDDDTADTNIENINIFDIPILFADNDGNILDDQNGNGSDIDSADVFHSLQSIDRLEPSKAIEIISEEIITDTIVGNDTIIEQQNGTDFNGLEIQHENGQTTPPSHTPTPKPLSRSGNFVVLNKSTLSQMKAVKHIPAGKIKKMLFPVRDNGDANVANAVAAAAAATTTTTTSTTNTVSKRMHSITLNNNSGASLSSPSLPRSQQQPQKPQRPQPPTSVYGNQSRLLSLDPSVQATHFEGFKRLVPNRNHTKTIANNITISTNNRSKSPPKSGILIKRNHLKNFTMRQLNVVRSTNATNDDTKADADADADAKIHINNNNNGMIRRSVQFSINNNSIDSKNLRSLKTLIDDLEN